jgi:hypothetical protein
MDAIILSAAASNTGLTTLVAGNFDATVALSLAGMACWAFALRTCRRHPDSDRRW